MTFGFLNWLGVDITNNKFYYSFSVRIGAGQRQDISQHNPD